METKTLLIGVIIGLFAGAIISFLLIPTADVEGLDTIEGQKQKITALEDAMDSYNDQVTLLENQILQMEAQLASLETENAALKSSLDLTLAATSFSRTQDTSALLQEWIGKANESIKAMLYLITQDELAEAVIKAHNRGIDVAIIIDDDWVSSSGSDYQAILDAGIDIRDDHRSGLLHHKVVIIDEYILMTGSYNWSASAEDRNDENLIILKSRTLAQTYLDEFDRLWIQTSP
jgi:phosphatidylserine/phosphatidylglycerophosphate/cardiolipin synthase-like enzyme